MEPPRLAEAVWGGGSKIIYGAGEAGKLMEQGQLSTKVPVSLCGVLLPISNSRTARRGKRSRAQLLPG
eukprot:scaffold8854_cov97-Skeletonema_dohrnii-CCMP3373.AAC.6